ncbi:MAG: amidase, partial [Armatimonadota bacterium]|nr:amidase [Armatimonadota bacterium]
LERVETQEPPADLRWVEFACAPPSGLASTVEWLANAPPQLPEDPLRLSLVQVARAIRHRRISPREVVEAALRRIEETNPVLRAFLFVDAEVALRRAREAEEAAVRGAWWGPLHGIPVALKDLIAQEGAPWTCGSPLRQGVVASEDAPVTARLRQAGAVFVGKTHLHEWAYGVSNDNPHFGPARNPWDPVRSPGGSSGGSGVALATGCVYGSVGTDTGGSIRIPAALCGVVGLKPTYGLVPTQGVYPLSWSLDHVGPMARTVDDVALLLEVLTGIPWGRSARIRGLRVGMLRNFFEGAVDADVARTVASAAETLRHLGAEVAEVRVEGLEAASAVATALLMVEASTGHLRTLRESPHVYGQDVRERLLVGLALGGERYVRARSVRRALIRRFLEEVFAQVDVLLTPTVPLPAPPLEEETTYLAGKPYNTRALLTRFTNPFNALGFPALSVPCGLVAGLPVGLQVVGRPFGEATLLRVARAYERARGPAPLPPTGPREGSG